MSQELQLLFISNIRNAKFSVTCFLVPDGLVWVFQKSLISRTSNMSWMGYNRTIPHSSIHVLSHLARTRIWGYHDHRLIKTWLLNLKIRKTWLDHFPVFNCPVWLPTIASDFWSWLTGEKPDVIVCCCSPSSSRCHVCSEILFCSPWLLKNCFIWGTMDFLSAQTSLVVLLWSLLSTRYFSIAQNPGKWSFLFLAPFSVN